MSLKSMRRWVGIAGLSLVAAASGCGSDSDPTDNVGPTFDSGRQPVGSDDKDAGGDEEKDASKEQDSGKSPAMDAGPSAMNVTCGTQNCTGTSIASMDVRACCVAGDAGTGAGGCGLNADDIKKANPSSKFTGCVPKDVPQASASSYCGEFWDEVETGGKDNGGLDIMSNGIPLTYEGCCLDTGECGAYLRSPRDIPGIDAHLGCVSFGRLKDAISSGTDAGMSTPKNLPFCNPKDGTAVTEGTVGGVPKFMCGCGKDTQPEEGVFPPCVANLPKEVCGRDEPSPTVLTTIPEYICGCTENSKLPCMKNVAATVCGTKAVDTSSADLAKLPEYICGCGPTSVDPGGAIPCLSNVEVTTCGKVQVSEEKDVEKLPEFLCGCGNDKLYDGNPDTFRCLSNVVATVCGGLDISSGHDSLKELPAYYCGCGNGELYDNEPFRCLSNVANSACGAVAISAANSPLLSTLPVYLCGCGTDNPYAAACLRNVDSRWCGARDVPVDDKGTPSVTTDNCLIGIAEYLRGCGPGTKPTANNPSCLRNVLNYPGCVNTVVDTRGTEATGDDCLVGVPEYAIGCGETVTTSNEDGCLPGAPDIYGCVDVKTTPANVPEYLCGCGNGQTNPAPPAYPCLTNVTPDVCGSAPITQSSQVLHVLNNVCGCGDGVSNRTACVKNVPATVCGKEPACDQAICAGGAPQGRTASCKSSNNDNIVDYCGLN